MVSPHRPQQDDFVRVTFDGIKLRDAEKLDEIGRKLFIREDGSYNRRDLFYFFLFQLRGFDDLMSGMERRMKMEFDKFRQEMLDGVTNGKTQE